MNKQCRAFVCFLFCFFPCVDFVLRTIVKANVILHQSGWMWKIDRDLIEVIHKNAFSHSKFRLISSAFFFFLFFFLRRRKKTHTFNPVFLIKSTSKADRVIHPFLCVDFIKRIVNVSRSAYAKLAIQIQITLLSLAIITIIQIFFLYSHQLCHINSLVKLNTLKTEAGITHKEQLSKTYTYIYYSIFNFVLSDYSF